MRLVIIHGPNLNLLGTRQPEVYGTQSFSEFLDGLRSDYPDVTLDFFQSNLEGELVNRIQECRKDADGIILNAGAYTHTSVALLDALLSVGLPCVEVHISHVQAREPFRRVSRISAACVGVISGLGLHGYALAVEFFRRKSSRA